jgi:hypothetical protein
MHAQQCYHLSQAHHLVNSHNFYRNRVKLFCFFMGRVHFGHSVLKWMPKETDMGVLTSAIRLVVGSNVGLTRTQK